jgi:hypothetical protein
MPTRALPSTLGFVLLAAVALAASAAPAGTQEPPAAAAAAADRAAVIEVVTAAYVDGIHNFRDPAAIRQGFHPGFEMLILKDGQLDRLPIEKWIESIAARNAKEPRPTERTTTAEFPLVEVTGTAAVCKVELTREGKHVFTDYLLLYRFADGWKIVSKIFHRHP